MSNSVNCRHQHRAGNMLARLHTAEICSLRLLGRGDQIDRLTRFVLCCGYHIITIIIQVCHGQPEPMVFKKKFSKFQGVLPSR